MKTYLVTMGVMAWFLSAPVMADDLDAIIESCAGCHGKDGISTDTEMPTIAGLSALVHEDAWFTYQDDARPCVASKPECDACAKDMAETDMCVIAKELDEDQIAAIAEHFAKLPFVAMKQDFDASTVAAGRAVHEEACAKCHSDGGSNPADDAGILAGQAKGYLARTFDEYKTGKRDQPKKMKVKMDELSAQDVVALVNYYASQQ